MNIYRISQVPETKLVLEKCQKLMDLLSDVEWGWYGVDNQKYYEVDENGENWWNTYCVMSPRMVLDKNIGTCIDQTILEQYWFRKYLPGIATRIIWMQRFQDDDHMCLVFYCGDRWYWFEHAWGEKKGIYGPYDDINDILYDINEDKKFKAVIREFFEYRKGITAEKFLKEMHYDYDREGEW